MPPPFADRYVLQSQLGRGHFGEVFEAQDTYLHRVVALKLLHPRTSIDEVLFEAQQLSMLEGPCVLRVLNAGIYNDVPFLVTDVAEVGGADTASRPTGVTPDLAIRWTRHALTALDACHSAGILHRDVKASNVFLDDESHARLGDFGVAASIRPDGTAKPHGDGRTLAPEGFATDELTVRSDVYSTGVLLYELLTGQFPNDGGPDDVQHGLYPDLRDLAPHVPRALARRVRRAMELDPADRFATAAGMNRALGAIAHARNSWVREDDAGTRRWATVRRDSGTHLEVVATEGADGLYEITTRRRSGARSRIRDLCTSGVRARRLPVELRKVFEAL